MPGAGDAAAVDRPLLERAAQVAADAVEGLDPVPVADEQHRDAAGRHPSVLAGGELGVGEDVGPPPWASPPGGAVDVDAPREDEVAAQVAPARDAAVADQGEGPAGAAPAPEPGGERGRVERQGHAVGGCVHQADAPVGALGVGPVVEPGRRRGDGGGQPRGHEHVGGAGRAGAAGQVLHRGHGPRAGRDKDVLVCEDRWRREPFSRRGRGPPRRRPSRALRT